MKRLVKTFLSSALVLSLITVPVLATESIENASDLSTSSSELEMQVMKNPCAEYINFVNELTPAEVEEYAYMDYDSASDYVKPIILEARTRIVYGEQSWEAEEGVLTVENADGSVENLPNFDELWPDWDLEQICEYNNQKEDYYEYIWGTPESGKTASFAGNVDLPLQSGQYGKTFYNFTGTGRSISVWATTLPMNTYINMGVKNEDTGNDVGFYTNCTVNQRVKFPTTSGVRYSVRASLTDKAGTCYMNVTE